MVREGLEFEGEKMSELSGIFALWYREFIIFTREKSRVISSVLTPLMWLVLFGSGLGSVVDFDGVNYRTYIFPVILSMAEIFSSIFFGTYIIWDKKIDFLKEVMVAPISRASIFLGKALGGTTDVIIQVMILLVIGVFLGIQYTITSIVGVLVIIFILTLGLVSIGLTLGSRMESTEGFGFIVSLVILPLFFLSGALYPVDKLPEWLMVFNRLDPVTYAVDGLRGIMLGLNHFDVLLDLGILVAFSLVMIGIGTYSFQKMKV